MISVTFKGYKTVRCRFNHFFGKEHVQEVILVGVLIILKLEVLWTLM